MADILLGISGSEVTLPIIKSIDRAVPDASVRPVKGISKAVMSDGSPRYAFFQIKREWPLEWEVLTYAQIQVLQGLYNLNQALRYQDNRESATWYDVIILSFSYDAISSISSTTTRWYRAAMVLAEI